MKPNTIEVLEARIAPAAIGVMDPIKLIVTITGDPAGDDISLVQGAGGDIQLIDNANAGALLDTFPLARGIVYNGGAAGDKVTIQLTADPLNPLGGASTGGLPEGLRIVDTGGDNEFTVEGLDTTGLPGALNVAVVKKFFSFTGGSDADQLTVKNLVLPKGLVVSGADGDDTLDFLDNTIAGPLTALNVENITGSNFLLGLVTVDNRVSALPTNVSIIANLIKGPVKLLGSAQDDIFATGGNIVGKVTVLPGAGINTVNLSSSDARVAPQVAGIDGDDTVNLAGFWRKGAILALGDGANTVKIGTDDLSTQIGGLVRVTTGLGDDTFSIVSQSVTDGVNTAVSETVLGSLTVALGQGTNSFSSLEKALISGNLIVTAGAADDTLDISKMRVGGKITLSLGDGLNTTTFATSTLVGGLTYKGGAGDDSLIVGGNLEGALTALLGNGANAVDINIASLGKAITLLGGVDVDTFTVKAFGASSLTALLGADSDVINFSGVYTSVNLDGGLDAAARNDLGTIADKFKQKNFL